ncbi:hypothetical protein SAMN05444401_2630 [Clostridium amylolyticum]|uniref:Uncharacterized protein n=1 Tax=Clostridium amylolyticum TaxID=1121298 RepID=A0A1M6I4G5_9CLOT|nr:hypothetical protein [Clostridium amylolyticum]SHJ29290.1 hypothetical protein SAMN05444401_2630 [Clostridium amylolyticum]
MKFNKKLVTCGLILFILTWTGNIIYYKNQILKEPLFMKHYYDIDNSRGEFRLSYIDNINSKDRVISIMFPEIGRQFYCSELSQNTDRRYYALKTIKIDFPNENMNVLPKEFQNKLITKAEVMLSNGKNINVDLGKIYIHSDETKENHLKTFGTTGSSDYTGSQLFNADRDIKVIGIKGKIYEEIKDVLRVSIEGKNLSDITFPINLKKGEPFDISYAFKFNKNDIRKNNAYLFTLDILTEDFQGNKGVTTCYLGYNSYSPHNYDIKTLKNSKGGE